MLSLFTPLKIRDIEMRNRVWVSPMCQYSSIDGMPTDWHLVHLGSRAVGGAGLVMVEATAVSPEGRISPEDSGIWSEAHGQAFQRITSFLKASGAVPGVQLAHAGRKASTVAPWIGNHQLPAQDPASWQAMAPSAVAFKAGWTPPKEMSLADIELVRNQFKFAALRSLAAGFEVVEIHAAHGYLLHSFLSPLSNQRTDEFGGSFENRTRFLLQTVEAVRSVWPVTKPIFVRISATDWVKGGWDLDQSIELAKKLKSLEVDLIDCSSGGLTADAKIPVAPSYQVAFAEEIRKKAAISTAAVGMITESRQANEIIESAKADAVFIARQFLRDPYWPLHAAAELKVAVPWPKQYERAAQ